MTRQVCSGALTSAAFMAEHDWFRPGSSTPVLGGHTALGVFEKSEWALVSAPISPGSHALEESKDVVLEKVPHVLQRA